MSSPTSMLSSSSTATSTTLLSTTCPTEERGRLSQTSTAVATPCHPRPHAQSLRAQSLRATIVGTDADLPDFEWEVFTTRDSLEIARHHIGVGPYQHLPVQRSRERREAYPFGRSSLEIVGGDVSRSHQPSHQRTRDEMKPKLAKKLCAKAKAVSGKAKAALAGVVGKCFGGGDDEDVEEKEGLIFG